MEVLLGCKEESMDDYQLGISTPSPSSSSYSYKLVPWLSWDEWLFVHESLFSNSPDSAASALRRISSWRSRGCLPVVIEVTASIIEIQQKDPHFRKDLPNESLDNSRADQSSHASLSDEMLAMLYCMAIMRLVNGVVEKTRKKTEISIAVAADAIALPRTLIDIRHEGSHRELPTLQIVRSASIQALDWLKYYYWEPQKKAIPFHGDETSNIRNEIRSKFHEFVRKVKEKRGSKKDVKKIVKNLVGLYFSFSSEVVSVLLEFLLKAINSSDSSEHPENTQQMLNISLDEWKPVIKRFSNKEPELLLALLNAVLDKIETQQAVIYETGGGVSASSDCKPDILQVEYLSCVFTWLVRNFEGLKPHHEKDSAAAVKVSLAEKTISKPILMALLRKCLTLSASANKELLGTAAHLARLAGDNNLEGKLKKLSSLTPSNLDVSEEDTCVTNSSSIFIQQDEFITEAAKKLELIKRPKMKKKVVGRIDADAGSYNRWALAKSWNPCPIGMLPRAVGSSGCLPVLDFITVTEKVPELLGSKENWQLNQCSSKREASPDMQLLGDLPVKKLKETVDGCASQRENVLCPPVGEDFSGHLMIGGVWKKVGQEELLAIKSAIRLLI